MSGNIQSADIPNWGGGQLRTLTVSGLRKEESDGWTRLTVDIEFANVPEAADFPERTLWVAVRNGNANMLADDVYDAFILTPLYMAMHYGAGLNIAGKVSRTLFRNASVYLQGILRDFSDSLRRVDVRAEGFKEAEGEPYIVGAGFSCGVDSLSTVYDHYVREDDPDYRISGLFMLNCGWHGNYYNPASRRMWLERCRMNQGAADELGLPMYLVDSNLHAFTYAALHGANDKLGYLAIYSCVLALQRAVRRYYMAGSMTYGETVRYGYGGHDTNFDKFASPCAVPLMSTEKLCFILDGCQHKRCEKISDIADWDIARKYLNVCLGDPLIFGAPGHESQEEAANCSRCEKCMRTQAVLEALGKLGEFSGVFDERTYRKHDFGYKCRMVALRNTDDSRAWVLTENYGLCREKGLPLPSPLAARAYLLASWLLSLPGRILRKAKRIITRKEH